MMESLLKVNELSIAFSSEGSLSEVVHSISFTLNSNEVLGIVGESGSGKSVSALALVGLLPKGISRITKGEVLFSGEELHLLPEKEYRKIRGKQIGMVFQEPMSSLNPSMACGRQVQETIRNHFELSKKQTREKVLELFEKVQLPRPKEIYDAYPHQLSGGQKQRVMIAMAIVCKPKILIADEATTALDVTVQKEIIGLLRELQQETGMSILFISHDLALVSEIAHRVVVMYKGRIVERGTIEEVFHRPQDAYTKALIASRPPLEYRLKRLSTIQDFLSDGPQQAIITKTERKSHHKKLYERSPLLRLIDVKKEYVQNTGWLGKTRKVKAVDGVSFDLFPGETLGLVGESGCGKSTLGNAILLLDRATEGTILYRGKDLNKLSPSEVRKLRREIQIIFQNPYASLNPRTQVGKAIMEPLKVHGLYTDQEERKEQVMTLLEQVGLERAHFYRYPHEFSGGQRQRIGIARAIVLRPKLIVCDESVSALDISLQAQVLNLLNDLKEGFGFSYIFISHDLAVVKYMADQMVVMNAGKIEEKGDADEVYAHPQKTYTKRLIGAVPKGL